MRYLSAAKLSAAALILTGTGYFAWTVSAHSTGMTGLTQKTGGEGCSCHGSQSSNVTVSINGPSEVAAGQTAAYTVTVTGGPLAKAGVDIAASAGSTLTPGSGLQTIGSELTHVSPKAPVSGTVTFDFIYKAPASAGTATLYATSNSVNANGNSIGDQWNHAPDKTITITSSTGVGETGNPSGFSLNDNYPNPFNPATTLSFTVPQTGRVVIYLRDIQGKTIRTLAEETVPAGLFSRSFDFSDLPSGSYLWSVAWNGKVETRKMTLLK